MGGGGDKSNFQQKLTWLLASTLASEPMEWLTDLGMAMIVIPKWLRELPVWRDEATSI